MNPALALFADEFENAVIGLSLKASPDELRTLDAAQYQVALAAGMYAAMKVRDAGLSGQLPGVDEQLPIGAVVGAAATRYVSTLSAAASAAIESVASMLGLGPAAEPT